MSAVAQPTESVDTLAAWITAYLAAPASADKVCFTTAELMAAAGFTAGKAADEMAMRKALLRSELRLARLATGDRARVWARQPIALALELTAGMSLQCPSLLQKEHGTQGSRYPLASHPATGHHAHCAQAQHQRGAPPVQKVHHSKFDPASCGLSYVESVNVAAPKGIQATQPLPYAHAPSLDDLETQAREAVQRTVAAAANRHWAFYREQSLDILGRLDRAISIHQKQARYALDIQEDTL